MANSWQTPYYQRDHAPSAPGVPGLASPAASGIEPQAEPWAEGCSCPLCSVTRHNDLNIWGTMTQLEQNPLPLCDPTVGVNNPMVIVPNMVDQPQARFSALRAPENASYAPLPEVEGPPPAQAIAGLNQPQVLNTPVTESLRRLAARYVNNPESLVNAVHLESGPSGRFQVVIMLEIDGIV